VVAELARGGAERMVVLLAQELTAAGHEVTVAAAGGPLQEELPGQCRRSVLAPPTRSLPDAARTVGALARIVRKTRPDIVHAHNVRMGGLASLSARAAVPGRRRPPVLVTFHGVVPDEYRTAARILRLADHVAAVSGDAAGRLREHGLPEARLSVVRNATPPAVDADPSALRRLDVELRIDGAPIVAIVGRLVPQKAHERFLLAAAEVHGRRPDVRFLVVGDGVLRAELERRTTELGLDAVVRFTGQRSDVPLLLHRVDLLAFSSDWEGLSIAALEALAAGVPVVSTPVEGMAELLRRGAGVVVADRRPQSLAGAMLELLDDEDRRATMGCIGRRLIEQELSPPAMVGAYTAVYRRLLQAPARG
jgi:glycosyltransferase involved in cell wall biosynthesis